ncbi:PAAR domain-containing protein [Pectobacterium polaris]|uniref:PAAR domain-containing protein n=1 Tax=Pectobacterium polaris TaxID=2042057 RepID=UPI000E73DC72|nr:PAAR domain-containing protein [Pectobacterium polaris]RJL26760.1 PAAR domain-containing protein [Pectobacterium polaris]
MSGRGAIRLGDAHSGGGKMIEASGFPVNGVPQCLLGDNAVCPTHKGTFPLVSGGDGSAVHNGRPMIFEPGKLACGCSVSSSCAGNYNHK